MDELVQAEQVVGPDTWTAWTSGHLSAEQVRAVQAGPSAEWLTVNRCAALLDQQGTAMFGTAAEGRCALAAEARGYFAARVVLGTVDQRLPVLTDGQVDEVRDLVATMEIMDPPGAAPAPFFFLMAEAVEQLAAGARTEAERDELETIAAVGVDMGIAVALVERSLQVP